MLDSGVEVASGVAVDVGRSVLVGNGNGEGVVEGINYLSVGWGTAPAAQALRTRRTRTS